MNHLDIEALEMGLEEQLADADEECPCVTAFASIHDELRATLELVISTRLALVADIGSLRYEMRAGFREIEEMITTLNTAEPIKPPSKKRK